VGKRKKTGELTRVMKFFNEFKEFAIKGNMVDMAVGVIVGGAFTALMTSLVSNIATPLISILIGFDLKDWRVTLPRLYGDAPASVLAIGSFLDSLTGFLILAFTVFLFVKALNKFRKKQGKAPPPKPTKEELLLAEIRDNLKERSDR